MLGAKNPTGVWVYARERDKPAVFVLGESVLRDATRPVADFRDRTILAFDAKDVTGLRDRHCPTRRSRWRAAADVADHAARWRCAPTARRSREFLDKLRRPRRCSEFVAEAPPSLDAYGLDRPVRVTIHTGRDKDRASRTLLLGRVDAGQEGRLRDAAGRAERAAGARGGLEPACPRTSPSCATRRVVDGRPRQGRRSSRSRAPRARSRWPGRADSWKIIAPAGAAGRPGRGRARSSSKLRDLRAQGFLTDDASGIAAVPAEAQVRVTLTEQGRRHHDRAAGAVARDARRRRQRVRGGGGPGAGGAGRRQGAGRARPLGRPSCATGDCSCALEPKDVKRVRVQAGGQTMRAGAQAATPSGACWSPRKGAANGAKVDDLVYMLRGLRWKDDRRARPARTPARYGLDAPDARGDPPPRRRRRDRHRAGRQARGRAGVRANQGAAGGLQRGQPHARPAPKVPDDFKG